MVDGCLSKLVNDASGVKNGSILSVFIVPPVQIGTFFYSDEEADRLCR